MITFYGGHSKEDPPVPIPNTEVKLFSADGTARATVWESRSPPFLYINPQSALMLVGGFVFCDDFEPLLKFCWNITNFEKKKSLVL